VSLVEVKFHELGGNEYKRATVQGPVGKLELQGGVRCFIALGA
jgi:hypothetical protein